MTQHVLRIIVTGTAKLDSVTFKPNELEYPIDWTLTSGKKIFSSGEVIINSVEEVPYEMIVSGRNGIKYDYTIESKEADNKWVMRDKNVEKLLIRKKAIHSFKSKINFTTPFVQPNNLLA